MSLTLLKIELSNIRSHKFINFEPVKEGVTAISGPNGAGKSTIVDALAWTIWGTKPAGVSRAASIIREGVEPGKKDKVYAEVTLKLDNSEIKIQRRIMTKGGAVECDVWERTDSTVDWKHVAGSSVSHTEAFLKKRLKMDEKGFLAAILVQQKQVDQLISSSPRERAEVIERLTGVSSITAALVEARQQYNTLRKVLQHSTVDETTLETLKKELEALETDFEAKNKERNTIDEKLGSVSGKYTSIETSLKHEESILEKVTSLNEEKVSITATIKTRESELERLIEQKDAKKNQLKGASGATDLKEIELKLTEARKSLRDNHRETDKLDTQLSNLNASFDTYKTLIAKSTVKTIDKAREGYATFQGKVDSIEESIKSLLESKTSANTEVRKINKAIQVITGGDGQCPTCLQHVEDPSKAIESLEKEKTIFEKTLTGFDKEHALLKNRLGKAIEGVEKFTSLIDSIENIKTVEGEIASIRVIKSNLEADQVTINSEVTGFEKLYNNARRNAEVKEEYDALRTYALEVSNSIESLKGQVTAINDELSRLKAKTNTEISRMRKEFNELLDSRTKLFEKSSLLREDSSLIEANIGFMKERIVNAETEISRYKDLLVNVQAHAHSVEVLEEFREDRIKSSIPIVGVYASDLLSRFTEGKFSQLKLDEKFNASVILANGVERPVGLLSGGELSAAAISLRLAISMLLNSGDSTNLMVLDEVLVSQDDERAELILSTIKEVCKGQVVMISHGSTTQEIADVIVEL